MISRQTIIWTNQWQLFISFHEQWSPVNRMTLGWRYQFGLKHPKIWFISAAFTATAIIAHAVFTLNYLKYTISGKYLDVNLSGRLRYIGKTASLYWTVSQQSNFRDQVQGFCLPTGSGT